MGDCYILYDDVTPPQPATPCNCTESNLPAPGTTATPENGFEKLLLAAAIGGGLWFLLFANKKKNKRK